ncbi:MAG: hypothetical protein RJA36_1774 [Pseudomonadota bacterium]|jgi:hypothetical protein
MKNMIKAIDLLANIIVYGGILLFLWILVGALLGAVWAVAARVFWAMT